MENHIDIIKKEFTKQSVGVNEYQGSSIKEEATDKLVKEISLRGNEQVLEVAAGTCALGRKIAPFVKHITELDITKAMLEKGKEANEKAGLSNASYIVGTAERLPFEDASFDVVVSRLAFHHFVEPDTVVTEMVRVLKPNGKLVILDMIADNNEERNSFNHYEKLRDPSHTNTLSEMDFTKLLKAHNLRTIYSDTTVIPMDLNAWLSLTTVSSDLENTIIANVSEELNGGNKTGLQPYMEEGKIKFIHTWLMLVAKK